MSEALEEMYLFGEEKMEKAIAQMKKEFGSVRTGRANPAVLDKVVETYRDFSKSLDLSFHEDTIKIMSDIDKRYREMEEKLNKQVNTQPVIMKGDNANEFTEYNEPIIKEREPYGNGNEYVTKSKSKGNFFKSNG